MNKFKFFFQAIHKSMSVPGRWWAQTCRQQYGWLACEFEALSHLANAVSFIWPIVILSIEIKSRKSILFGAFCLQELDSLWMGRFLSCWDGGRAFRIHKFMPHHSVSCILLPSRHHIIFISSYRYPYFPRFPVSLLSQQFPIYYTFCHYVPTTSIFMLLLILQYLFHLLVFKFMVYSYSPISIVCSQRM